MGTPLQAFINHLNDGLFIKWLQRMIIQETLTNEAWHILSKEGVQVKSQTVINAQGRDLCLLPSRTNKSFHTCLTPARPITTKKKKSHKNGNAPRN